jgi:hypothetical protein
MESQIWSNSQEKRAYILQLRGQEVNVLKVTGNVLTLKRNVSKVLESLQQGQPASSAGASSVETLDTRTIKKAEVSPGNSSLTLHGGPEGSKKVSYSTSGSDADQILQTILATTGQTFQQSKEEIGVMEALLPPAIFGGLTGLFWWGVYQYAGQAAAGEEVEITGRRRGFKQILLWVAEMLGTTGTIAVGVVLLALILGWAAARVVKRPERTVWVPQQA